MKATFDGRDYMLLLDRETNELQKLRHGKLESTLMDLDGNDVGKIVTLEHANNDAIDGILVSYLPENPHNWEAIKQVAVKINQRAHNYIIEQKTFGTRYDAWGDKIEIFDGDPSEW